MKHTPGPWHVGNVNKSRNKEFISINCGEGNAVYTIAQTIPLRDSATDEDRANARLIAAAPELLEALADLCYVVGHAYQDSNVFKNARKVIEKATGEKEPA